MAFRNKAQIILDYKPDILIVPECEHPDKLLFKNDIVSPNDMLWFGSNRNKGLAIFSYSDFKLEVLKGHNEDLKMIIPIRVIGKSFEFNLFAIWANNPNDPDGQYVAQIWKAINEYGSLFLDKQTLLIGDFNSNTIWDRKRKIGSHSHVVKYLEEKGIVSLYHLFYNQKQGEELHPTLYMYRHKDKPYHIDYCFASLELATRLKSVEIGEFDFWIKYSDHVPLIVTFDVL